MLVVVAGCSQSVAEPKQVSVDPASVQSSKQQVQKVWRIARVEKTESKWWQVRIAHVISSDLKSPDHLRDCVREVYAQMREEILNSQTGDRQQRKVIVHVYWSELEDLHDGGSWIAHVMVEKQLPKQLDDEQIKIVWRAKETEPSRQCMEQFFEVKAAPGTKKRKTIEAIAKRDDVSVESLRRRLVHVWLWQQAKPVAETDLDHWLAEDDGSVFGGRD